jgi:transcription antitermination factor NusG
MNWFVLYTKPRFEKKVEERLLSFGIEAYCPTRKEIRLWSDRKKKVDVPVLPSMVLVRLEEKNVNDVFNINGVIRYMFWLGKRAVIREKEVDVLKNYLKGNKLINQEIRKLNPGNRINLEGFNNEDGLVEKVSNNTVWVFLENLGYKIKLNLV